MREYHHLGIPTDIKRENETYLEHFDTWISGFNSSPYGVEWMRFGPDAPVLDLVWTVPHLAFRVDDLYAELNGKDVLIEPNSPSEDVVVAFIVDNGAPIEFLQIKE